MNTELHIEWWPIDKVKPYEHNPRKIPQRAIDKVGLSIDQNGWRQPIVVDKNGVIVAGTVRWLSGKKNGLERVPVHVADDMTPAQVRAYRIMDNRSHQDTDWDLDLLKFEIAELKALELDLKFTGFEAREIDEFLVSTDPADDDAANQMPPVPTKPISRLGDLWRCGPHRVLHGDATNPEDTARVMGTYGRNS